MKTRLVKIFALLLVVCFVVTIVPAVKTSAGALTVSIDSINGSKSTSGTYIWTTGTFDAQYWVVIDATYVSYNVYKVAAVYPTGAKSVTVQNNHILLVSHMAHAQYDNVCKIGVGDVLSLYNINLSSGSCNSGYVRVSSSYGLTLDTSSKLAVDHSKKIISGVGTHSKAGDIKTHFCEATDELVVKDARGNVVNDSSYLGNGYTIQSAKSGTYTICVSGDLDGNATTDTTDYSIFLRGFSDGAIDLTGAVYDLNGDKFVNTTDILAMRKFIAGETSALTPVLSKLNKTEPEEIVVPESHLRYHAKTFLFTDVKGTHSGTVISNGKLTLASGSTSGTFTTDVMNIGTFKMMLASWNAVTNGGKLSLSVSYELTNGAWSSYLSWGTWSTSSGVSGSASPSTTYGSIDVDILTVSSSYKTTGNIRVRLTLNKYNGGVPVVENFSIATPQMALQQTVNKSALPTSYLNNVPMRSQLASENGSIGNIICSPTTTAMALEYLGTKVTSLTAAKAMYDNNWGAYGNWSLATAYAGEKGYYAFLDFYNTDMMKYALSQGCVLGCTTSLTSSGHLVLVVGYTVINGVEYFIVNDPNVNENNVVRTNYTVSYFESKWLRSERGGFGVVYVFQGVYDLNKR